MGEIYIGICMQDQEYAKRFASFLMKRYAKKIRPVVFTDLSSLETACQEERKTDVFLLEGYQDLFFGEEQIRDGKIREMRRLAKSQEIFYLRDKEGKDQSAAEHSADLLDKGVIFMEKYQDVNAIVEEIMKRIGKEAESLFSTGELPGRVHFFGVYSLGANEYQLPFAMTFASVLSEKKKKILLLDLQENSGIFQLTDRNEENGLEELLVMNAGSRYSRNRMLSCIGHIGEVDFIYPARNTENICEAGDGTIPSLLGMISRELSYDAVVINLGARFPGFFETLSKCSTVFLMKRPGLTGKWREEEFRREIRDRSQDDMESRIMDMEVPVSVSGASSCSRLIEQWKWSEPGDKIRRYLVSSGLAG